MTEFYLLAAAFVGVASSLAWMVVLLKRELLDPVVDDIARSVK